MVQIIGVLGARRRELGASTGERLRLLNAHARASELRHTGLDARLTRLEDRLACLERARPAHVRPLAATPRKRQGGVHRGRDRTVGGRPGGARWQLGSALIFVGSLVVLWVALLELGLALGL